MQIKKWQIIIGVLLVLVVIGIFVDDEDLSEPVPASTVSSPSSASSSASSSVSSSSSSAASAFKVDWEKCISDFTEEVTNPEYFGYVRDVYVEMSEDQITFSAVLDDSTKPEIALEYADTIIRRFNAVANMQDSNATLGNKEYLGGLYDKYDILIGIAPSSKVDDQSQWFVFDAIAKGVHSGSPIELQAPYK